MIEPLSKNDQDMLLIDHILAGDQSTCALLIDRHKSYAFTIAQRILASREEAEEATQDAFVKALRALDNFNRQAKFSTWLYRIVFNTAISYKRKRKIKSEPLEDYIMYPIVTSNNLAAMQHKERQAYLQQAMNTLMLDDVTMLTLFYLKEFSLEEIEEITGIAANTAKVKVYRARKRLASALRKLLRNEVDTLL